MSEQPAMEAYGTFRYGKGECECQADHKTIDGHCDRLAKMFDGWYICARCKRHAPQLQESEAHRG